MNKVVLGHGGDDATSGGVRGYAMLVPVLVGLIAPLVLIVLLNPAMLENARAGVMTLLVVLFCLVTLIFIYSVFAQKVLARVIFDPALRKAQFVHESLFAADIEELPFDRIRELRVHQHYDRDGYSAPRAELVLRNGDVILLPEGILAAHCLEVNALLRPSAR
jgi:hypothetical protein